MSENLMFLVGYVVSFGLLGLGIHLVNPNYWKSFYLSNRK